MGLLERRGARVEWAPALSLDPNHVDDAQLRAATEDVLSRPIDMFLATTGVGMKAWFAAAERWGILGRLLDAIGDAEILARGPKSVGALRRQGLRELWAPRVGVLRGRPGAPARPRPHRPADRRPGARPVALDGRPRAAPPGRGRHGRDRLPGRRRRGPGPDVPDGRPGRGPQARRGHVHLGSRRRGADGRRRRDRPPRRGRRRVPGRRGRHLRRPRDRGRVRALGRAQHPPRPVAPGRDGEADGDRAARTPLRHGDHRLRPAARAARGHRAARRCRGADVRGPAGGAPGAGGQPRARPPRARSCSARCRAARRTPSTRSRWRSPASAPRSAPGWCRPWSSAATGSLWADQVAGWPGTSYGRCHPRLRPYDVPGRGQPGGASAGCNIHTFGSQ